MNAQIVHMKSFVTIRRECFLPQEGKVLVRKGQHVLPDEVLAVCESLPEYLLFDYARGLGLPAQKADRLLQVKVGQEIEEKDILAGPVGWAKRVVRSSKKGKVVLAGDGQLLLGVVKPPFELKAGFEAIVADLIAGRGVILETNGDLIQGIWGNGKCSSGVLMNPYQAAEEELSAEHFTLDMRDAVLMGGWVSKPSTLKSAAEFPLRGVILGGLAANLIGLAREMPYPILVLDGFGAIGMNSLAYQILSKNERKQISINAGEWDRLNGTRPEAIVGLSEIESEEMVSDLVELSAGQTVRICNSPYFGKIGHLERIIPGRTILSNGISIHAGEILLEDGEKVISPLDNIEVIL